MQVPDHDPDFWDRLAGGLDDLEADMGLSDAYGSFDAVAYEVHENLDQGAGEDHWDRSDTDHWDRADADHSDAGYAGGGYREAVAEARQPERLAPRRASGQVHIDAPTASLPVAAFTGASPGGSPVAGRRRAPVRRVADPLARLTIEHDAAALPQAMRRVSNAVLLAVALVALMVAMYAGLSLVRQRSEGGAPPAAEESSGPGLGQPGEGGDTGNDALWGLAA